MFRERKPHTDPPMEVKCQVKRLRASRNPSQGHETTFVHAHVVYDLPFNIYKIQRIVSCFALSQSDPLFAYRVAYAPLLCSYCGVSKSLLTTYVHAHVVYDLLTLE